MKFTIDKNSLQDSLIHVSKIVPIRSTMPILNCALFSVASNTLLIKTTNLNTYISSEINLDSGEDGTTCIPVIKLTEILTAMPECKLNFSVSSNGKITINNNIGNYTIMSQSSEEFPSEPIIDSTNSISFKSEKLRNIINSTLYAVSKDDLKPVLQGVLLNINNQGITAVSTDGHRLVKISTLTESQGNQKIVIPYKFLSVLLDNINDNKTIDLQISENHIMVQLSNMNIISRTIKDQYPDFEAVIPYENNKKVEINRNDLIDAVKRVSIFSNKTTKQITLSFTEGETTISTEDPDNVTSAKESIQCDYNDENIVIGYNAQFLLDILKKQVGENVIIKLENALTAGIFLPEKKNEEEDKLTLLMPIRLND